MTKSKRNLDRSAEQADRIRQLAPLRMALLFFLAFQVALLGACDSHERPTQQAQKTYRDLHTLGSLVADLVTAGEGERVRLMGSPKDLFAYVAKNGMHGFDGGLVNDAWGRPFRWTVVESKGRTIIRVSSAGQDGKSQDGEGDGLYVEVTFCDKSAQLRIKRLEVPF